MKKKYLNQEGQSLIEVVIALAVAVLVLLALVGITISSINNASFSRNQSLATKYAKQVMEEIRNHRETVPWADFVGPTNDCTSNLGITFVPPSQLDPAPANPKITCTCLDNSCNIRVEVVWTDSKGTHTSDLSTILTNRR